MIVQVNIAEAKAKLSSLLDRALAGEEIVIARAGNPWPAWLQSKSGSRGERARGGAGRRTYRPTCFSLPWIRKIWMPPKANSATSSGSPYHAQKIGEVADRFTRCVVVAGR